MSFELNRKLAARRPALPTSATVDPVTAAIIAGRLGDPHRFHSLAAIRAYSGLIPKLSQSGQSQYIDQECPIGNQSMRMAAWRERP